MSYKGRTVGRFLTLVDTFRLSGRNPVCEGVSSGIQVWPRPIARPLSSLGQTGSFGRSAMSALTTCDRLNTLQPCDINSEHTAQFIRARSSDHRK